MVGYQAPVVWESARGSVVTDVDGNRFIDWTSGVLVTNVGHCHPHLVATTQEATAQLLNNYECANVPRIEAARRLVQALPDHLDRCFFLTTGSEAIEAAARLMKRRTGKFEIISFEGASTAGRPALPRWAEWPGPSTATGRVCRASFACRFPTRTVTRTAGVTTHRISASTLPPWKRSCRPTRPAAWPV